MKFFPKVIFLIFILTATLLAQETTETHPLKEDKVIVSQGKGAFTSGLQASVFLKNHTSWYEFTANNDRSYVVYGKKLSIFRTGISGGFFKNMPWIGPEIFIEPWDIVSFMIWPGWRAGDPWEPSTNIKFFTLTIGGSLSLPLPLTKTERDRVFLSYYWTDFMGTNTKVPGLSYSFPLNSKLLGGLSAEYELITDEPLYNIKLIYLGLPF